MSTFVTKRAESKNIPIRDADAPLILEVTKSDITRATQKNSRCCAYARACKRSQLGAGLKEAFFFRSTAYLEYGDRMVKYALPPSVQKEIVSFDRAKVMAPGVYKISPPSKSQRIEEVKKRGRKIHRAQKARGYTPPKTGKKRGLVHRTALIRTFQNPDA